MIRRVFGNLHFLIVLAAVMAAAAGLIAVVSQAQERKADRTEISLLREQVHMAEERDAKHARELADAAREREELLAGQQRLLDYLAAQGYDIPDSVLRPIFRNETDNDDDADDGAGSSSSTGGSGKQSPPKVAPPRPSPSRSAPGDLIDQIEDLTDRTTKDVEDLAKRIAPTPNPTSPRSESPSDEASPDLLGDLLNQ
jgi:hypothetical protein